MHDKRGRLPRRDGAERAPPIDLEKKRAKTRERDARRRCATPRGSDRVSCVSRRTLAAPFSLARAHGRAPRRGGCVLPQSFEKEIGANVQLMQVGRGGDDTSLRQPSAVGRLRLSSRRHTTTTDRPTVERSARRRAEPSVAMSQPAVGRCRRRRARWPSGVGCGGGAISISISSAGGTRTGPLGRARGEGHG